MSADSLFYIKIYALHFKIVLNIICVCIVYDDRKLINGKNIVTALKTKTHSYKMVPQYLSSLFCTHF